MDIVIITTNTDFHEREFELLFIFSNLHRVLSSILPFHHWLPHYHLQLPLPHYHLQLPFLYFCRNIWKVLPGRNYMIPTNFLNKNKNLYQDEEPIREEIDSYELTQHLNSCIDKSLSSPSWFRVWWRQSTLINASKFLWWIVFWHNAFILYWGTLCKEPHKILRTLLKMFRILYDAILWTTSEEISHLILRKFLLLLSHWFVIIFWIKWIVEQITLPFWLRVKCGLPSASNAVWCLFPFFFLNIIYGVALCPHFISSLMPSFKSCHFV